MNFDLSENELMIQQMVKDFAEKEIRPNIMKWDESQEFPVDLFKKAGSTRERGACKVVRL